MEKFPGQLVSHGELSSKQKLVIFLKSDGLKYAYELLESKIALGLLGAQCTNSLFCL